MAKSYKAQAAEDAINRLFNDRSVPASNTLADLEEIEASVSSMIDALKEDIERGRAS